MHSTPRCCRVAAVLSMLLVCALCSVHQAELASTIARDGYKLWEPLLSSATETAAQHLKGTNVQVEHVNYEHTRIAPGIMYNIGLEFDIGTARGQRYELSFLHPTTEWRPIWNVAAPPSSSHPSLSNAAPSSTALSFLHETLEHTYKPELSMTLRGPLEVYIKDPMTELHIRVPREVDVGVVRRIVLEDGVNMTVSGFNEMHLLDPLVVSGVSIEKEVLKVRVRNTPRVALIGGHVDIMNTTADEALKVRRLSGKADIEVVSASGVPYRTTEHPIEIPLDDPRLRTIQTAMQQLQQSTYADHTMELRKMYYSKLEAVTGVYLPIEASGEDGQKETWDVVVVQGANAKRPGRIVQMHQREARTEVSFEPGLAANGTLHSAMQDFYSHHYEYMAHL